MSLRPTRCQERFQQIGNLIGRVLSVAIKRANNRCTGLQYAALDCRGLPGTMYVPDHIEHRVVGLQSPNEIACTVCRAIIHKPDLKRPEWLIPTVVIIDPYDGRKSFTG